MWSHLLISYFLWAKSIDFIRNPCNQEGFHLANLATGPIWSSGFCEKWMHLYIDAIHCHLHFSSNPSVQVEAMEGGALQKLLTLLATQRPITVKKKVWPTRNLGHYAVNKGSKLLLFINVDECIINCWHSDLTQVLFAVASLLRHFPFAQSHFLKLGGVQVLSELFQTPGTEPLRMRIITVLYDMIIEKVNICL